MRFMMRFALVFGALALVLAVTFGGGLRQGLLALLGIGFGAVLQGARFGFTTGWRNYIENRDPQGLWAQMLLIVLAAAISLPLIANNAGELVGAVAPLTISLVLGAFLFGAAMQLADGCGSGTLYKAGAGAPISFAVLPTFAIGSFVGASHQPAWIALGGLPPVDMLQFGWPVALAITVAGCGLVAWLAAWARASIAPRRQFLRRQLLRHRRVGRSAGGSARSCWPVCTWRTWWWQDSRGASSMASACGAPRRLPSSAGARSATHSGAWPRMPTAWRRRSWPT